MRRWSLLVATYDGSTMKIYVGGSEVASQSGPVNIPKSSVPLNIGKGDTGFFAGAIDDNRIYDRALSVDDIARLLAKTEGP
jgi:hypothetical protein